MKTLLPFTLLLASAGLLQASIVETITLDLSPLHTGSFLSGTFTLSDSPAVGDTAPVTLLFSDPANYSVASLTSTITIQGGTPSGYRVNFSPLTFTNLSGVTTPINTRDVSLTAFAFAGCTSFPCSASGLFQDRSPAVFSSTYTISPAQVPEPSYSLLLPVLLIGIVFARKIAGFRLATAKV